MYHKTINGVLEAAKVRIAARDIKMKYKEKTTGRPVA
jgi:hypothetical protein